MSKKSGFVFFLEKAVPLLFKMLIGGTIGVLQHSQARRNAEEREMANGTPTWARTGEPTSEDRRRAKGWW